LSFCRSGLKITPVTSVKLAEPPQHTESGRQRLSRGGLDSEHFERFVDIARHFAAKCPQCVFPAHIEKQTLLRSECPHQNKRARRGHA
jgi:hypothetical protein